MRRKEPEVHKKIVFVDFDGTVTTEDTLAGALKMTVTAEEYRARHADLLAGRVTLSGVLREAFEKAPSARVDDFVEYAASTTIREGFSEFLDAMREKRIPVVILSGGLRPMLEARLGPYLDRIHSVHCVDVDLSGPTIRLVSPYDDGNELLNKSAVMATYDYGTSICVGDSHSDVSMARASDVVFARDYLAEYLQKAGVGFTRWNDFNDVASKLR
ncbi:MAG: HAD-IB family phosphatase [Spirochaetes bacterium]|nr:HAD-IB family phosphatase [Spirochaetota bacterium]MBU1081293.1 HAD-IB family phosphatase [Spirochaetota bacterium]